MTANEGSTLVDGRSPVECARKPEEAGSHAGSRLQQVGARAPTPRLGRFEKLTHYSEGEVALQLGPRDRRARIPPSVAAILVAASSAVLPIPAGPSITTNVPVRASLGQRGLDSRAAPRSVRGAARRPPSFTLLHATPIARTRFQKDRGVATVRMRVHRLHYRYIHVRHGLFEARGC